MAKKKKSEIEEIYEELDEHAEALEMFAGDINKIVPKLEAIDAAMKRIMKRLGMS
tara:strand:+ start:774 stop:938 length:165 start_codon:yes stop_codon:yes gene_type:complete